MQRSALTASIAQGTGTGKRDLALSQVAFYAGARGVLKELDHMIAEGDRLKVANL
jgi:hypothetical protein